MLRMRRLLESGVWLLMPGPKEGERSTGAAVACVLFAGLVLLNGVSPGSIFNPFSRLAVRPVVPFLVAALLLSAVLNALPTGRRRARLGARVALTLAVFAFIVWFPVVRLDLGAYGALVAALLVLAFLWFNHAVNRRRALRSLAPPWTSGLRRIDDRGSRTC